MLRGKEPIGNVAHISYSHCSRKELSFSMLSEVKVSVSCSVVSDFLRPHGLQPARLPCPWSSPSKNTGVGCHSLSRRIFQIQRLNPGLPHCANLPPNHLSSKYTHTSLFQISKREKPAWSLPWGWVLPSQNNKYLNRKINISEQSHSNQ